MLEAQINCPRLCVPVFAAMPGASGDVNTDQVYRTQLRCECYSGKTKRSKYKDDITELGLLGRWATVGQRWATVGRR